MIIHLATDHAGYEHKEALKAHLLEKGYQVVDHGALTLDENDDYPDFIQACAKAVSIDATSMGIIFGGSGQGEAMCANRTRGIRAITYYGYQTDILVYSRQHNNANILSLGARFVTTEEVAQAADLWLATPFSGDERHIRRLSKF